MIDHVGIPVSDLARATEFYLKALAPLGIGMIMQVSAEQTGKGGAVGFGAEMKPFFWIGEGEVACGQYVHVAFAAQSRADVDAFYQAALAAGAKDNGAPGLRPHYHADYYGAFVIDPDGNNIEAVCHIPE
jgi:catechol 2,3-dioxygenase-like lactoylglutathione lyase family enzyme